MKSMKSNDLRNLKVEELTQKLGEARENVRKLGMRKVTRQLEDTVSVRIARREVARVTTIISEKNRSAAKTAVAGKE